MFINKYLFFCTMIVRIASHVQIVDFPDLDTIAEDYRGRQASIVFRPRLDGSGIDISDHHNPKLQLPESVIKYAKSDLPPYVLTAWFPEE